MIRFQTGISITQYLSLPQYSIIAQNYASKETLSDLIDCLRESKHHLSSLRQAKRENFVDIYPS